MDKLPVVFFVFFWRMSSAEGEDGKMKKGVNKREDFFELSEEEQAGVKKNSFQHKLLSAFQKLYAQKERGYVLIPRPFLKLCQNTGSAKVTRYEHHKKKLVPRTRQTNDLSTAIFLAHLLYLTGKERRADNFIYKSATEWHEEAGLTPHQVRQAALWHKEKEFIEVKIDTARGRNTNHYRINQKKLVESIIEIVVEDFEKVFKGMQTSKKAKTYVRNILNDCITDKSTG